VNCSGRESDPSLKLGIERAGWKPLEAASEFHVTHKSRSPAITSAIRPKPWRNPSNILASADSQQQPACSRRSFHEERARPHKKASDASSARTFPYSSNRARRAALIASSGGN